MKTAGDEGSNLRLDVGVQHAHNAGDKRPSDVVPHEGLCRVLERLHNPTHVRRVVPVLVRDVMPAPPGTIVRMTMCVSPIPPYTYTYMSLCSET